MKKFLDILLIVAVTFIIVNIFTPEPKPTGLNVGVVKKNYTVPVSLGIKIQNYTDKSVEVSPCEDISILKSGTAINISGSVCDKITVNTGEEKTINYAQNYDAFTELGEYTVKANIAEKEFFPNFSVSHKGMISNLFSGLIYAPIYNLIVFFIELFNSVFGWAVVAVTIVIRILLLYPQHRMMVSQRKLQALQPKIKKLQEEYKGQQQVLGVKIMELYKQEKVNPFGSCGFLLIQMPILFVMYHIILEIKDPTNLVYLYSFLEKFNLDKVDYNFYGLDLLQSGGVQGILLALTIAAIQFVQIKLSLSYNKKPDQKKGVVLEKKKDENKYSSMMPDPEIMNKVMLYGMPIMVGVFTYTLFAGVGIYWGISTLFMLFQQLFVNKMLKK